MFLNSNTPALDRKRSKVLTLKHIKLFLQVYIVISTYILYKQSCVFKVVVVNNFYNLLNFIYILFFSNILVMLYNPNDSGRIVDYCYNCVKPGSETFTYFWRGQVVLFAKDKYQILLSPALTLLEQSLHVSLI